MYRIGICDDEMETCFQIEHDLLNYGENKNIVIDTEVFSNGEELCGCLSNKERFDREMAKRYNNYEKRCANIIFRNWRQTWKLNGIFIWKS